MHITLEADYAVRIVECLASHPARIDAKTIAQITGVTPRFTLKILHKLGAAEIVRSYKGVKGGYELARKSEDITLCEVIETVEGPYAFSRCILPNHDCKGGDDFSCNNGSCRFQKTYDEITDIVRQKLSEVTF